MPVPRRGGPRPPPGTVPARRRRAGRDEPAGAGPGPAGGARVPERAQADEDGRLAEPGRDPREDLPPPIFKKGVLRLEGRDYVMQDGDVITVKFTP